MIYHIACNKGKHFFKISQDFWSEYSEEICQCSWLIMKRESVLHSENIHPSTKGYFLNVFPQSENTLIRYRNNKPIAKFDLLTPSGRITQYSVVNILISKSCSAIKWWSTYLKTGSTPQCDWRSILASKRLNDKLIFSLVSG